MSFNRDQRTIAIFHRDLSRSIFVWSINRVSACSVLPCSLQYISKELSFDETKTDQSDDGNDTSDTDTCGYVTLIYHIRRNKIRTALFASCWFLFFILHFKLYNTISWQWKGSRTRSTIQINGNSEFYSFHQIPPRSCSSCWRFVCVEKQFATLVEFQSIVIFNRSSWERCSLFWLHYVCHSCRV